MKPQETGRHELRRREAGRSWLQGRRDAHPRARRLRRDRRARTRAGARARRRQRRRGTRQDAAERALLGVAVERRQVGSGARGLWERGVWHPESRPDRPCPAAGALEHRCANSSRSSHAGCVGGESARSGFPAIAGALLVGTQRTAWNDGLSLLDGSATCSAMTTRSLRFVPRNHRSDFLTWLRRSAPGTVTISRFRVEGYGVMRRAP